MAKWGVILCVLAAFVMVGCESSSRFDELFKPSWAFDHFTYDGEAINMKLDNHSGTWFLACRLIILHANVVEISLFCLMFFCHVLKCRSWVFIEEQVFVWES